MFGFLLQHQSNNIKQIWCSMDKIFIYILLPTNDNIAGTWWCIVLIALLHRDDLISSPSRPYTDNGDQIHRSVRWIPNHFPSCGTLQDIITFSNMHVNTFYYNHYLYYTCIVILAIHKITLTVDYTTTVCVPVCGMVDRPPSKVNSFLHRKVVSVAAV